MTALNGDFKNYKRTNSCGEKKTYTLHEIIAILMKSMYRGLLIIYAFIFLNRGNENKSESEREETGKKYTK